MPSWDLKYNENSLKSSSKIAEILKIAKKKLFLEEVDFCLILKVAQKHEKRVMSKIRGLPVGGGGPQDGNL